MNIKRKIVIGVLTGLALGISLFIVGAIASQIIYGPQLAPEGKFDPDQLNAWYFIWTKLVLGIIFGVIFIMLYEALPLSKRMQGLRDGLKYAFMLWAVINLWELSHPLIYNSDTLNWQDQIFWLIYTLGGFLGYGAAIGYAYKRQRENLVPSPRSR